MAFQSRILANLCVLLCIARDRKLSISYKGVSQLPKEPELRELKIYVGMFCMDFSLNVDCWCNLAVNGLE